MPRADYLRYFARDKNNNYAGTEPEMRWTEEMLSEQFGTYQNLPSPHWVMKEDSEGQVFIEEEIEGEMSGVFEGKMGVSISQSAL